MQLPGVSVVDGLVGAVVVVGSSSRLEGAVVVVVSGSSKNGTVVVSGTGKVETIVTAVGETLL